MTPVRRNLVLLAGILCTWAGVGGLVGCGGTSITVPTHYTCTIHDIDSDWGGSRTVVHCAPPEDRQ